MLRSFVSMATAVTSAVTKSSPEVEEIINVLTQVQNELDNLHKVVKEQGADHDPMVEASSKIVSTITNGTKTISKSSELSLAQSSKLLNPVSELKEHTQTLADRIKQVKAQIDSQGNTEIVRQQVNDINKAAEELVLAMLSKIEQTGRGLAHSRAREILTILSNLERTFSTTQS